MQPLPDRQSPPHARFVGAALVAGTATHAGRRARLKEFGPCRLGLAHRLPYSTPVTREGSKTDDRCLSIASYTNSTGLVSARG